MMGRNELALVFLTNSFSRERLGSLNLVGVLKLVDLEIKVVVSHHMWYQEQNSGSSGRAMNALNY